MVDIATATAVIDADKEKVLTERMKEKPPMKKGQKGKKSENGAPVERDDEGRPQLPKRIQHNVQIGMRLSEDEERALLEEAAKDKQHSMSNFLRAKCGLPPLR